MENNSYKNAIIIERGTTYGYGRHATLKEAMLEENKLKDTLSGGSVFFKGASVGFYTESGCLMGVIPITAPHTIMTVKEWVRRKKRDDKKKAIDEFIKKEYGYEEKN